MPPLYFYLLLLLSVPCFIAGRLMYSLLMYSLLFVLPLPPSLHSSTQPKLLPEWDAARNSAAGEDSCSYCGWGEETTVQDKNPERNSRDKIYTHGRHLSQWTLYKPSVRVEFLAMPGKVMSPTLFCTS